MVHSPRGYWVWPVRLRYALGGLAAALTIAVPVAVIGRWLEHLSWEASAALGGLAGTVGAILIMVELQRNLAPHPSSKSNERGVGGLPRIRFSREAKLFSATYVLALIFGLSLGGTRVGLAVSVVALLAALGLKKSLFRR